MVIAGVLCLGAALLSGALGLWWLLHPRIRPRTAKLSWLAPLRAMAPAQLAAAIMLAVGGLVVLVGPSDIAVVTVVISVTGALGTLVAGSWQSARFVLRRQKNAADCGNDCASCTLSCGRSEPMKP
ncbi:MAG: hypothetical protein K2Q25_14395 [Mycobacteriaceae bacterium]|nr:hypothetical protein [Mycobacteriaceae bacterium]